MMNNNRRIHKEMRSLISLSVLLGLFMLLQFLWYRETGIKAMLSVDFVLSPTSPLASQQQEQQQRMTISSSNSVPESTSTSTISSAFPDPLVAKEPLFLSDDSSYWSMNPQNNETQNNNMVVIIGILSARENFERRQTIRQLWKDEVAKNYGAVVHHHDNPNIPIRALPIFLIGAQYCEIPSTLRTYWFQCQAKIANATNNNNHKKKYDEWKIEQEQVTKRLWKEDEQHRDLLFLNISDYYHNSPFKVATFLAWASSMESTNVIPNVKFVMKMDDDVYLDWRRLSLQLYNHMIHRQDLMMTTTPSSDSSSNQLWWWGYLRTNEIVHRNISDRFTARWSISPNEWIPKTWPPFMSGGGNVLNMAAAKYVAQNYHRLHQNLFGEDIALGVWLSGTNIRYEHDGTNFPKTPRLANCSSNVILFMGQAIYKQCESEAKRRIAMYQNDNNKTLGIHERSQINQV